MKHMNKILALVLALTMVLGLAISASAANTPVNGPFTVTINNATGHEYVIYQIFTGDLATNDEGEEILSNIKYGADYVPEGKKVGDDAVIPENFDPTTIVPTGKGTAMTTTGDKATATVEAAGYYMIVDVTTELPTGEAPSAVIFQVVGDTEITSKHPKTTIVKKTQDINDSTGEQLKDGESVWIDSADYDIGDTVPFKSTANFEGLVNYDTYKVVFTDIMAKGLTYKNDMVVLVNGEDKTSSFTIATSTYENAEDAAYNEGTKITVTCEDIKAIIGKDANTATIELVYSATLNEDANFGAPGNPNKIKVTTTHDGEGETPWDVNIVFTYKVVVNKVDENEQPLAGAEFQLEKFIADENGAETYNEIKGYWKALGDPVKTEAGDTFGFDGLDDGVYRLTETVTPAGYNTIDPIIFIVTAEHDIVAESPALKSLSGDKESGEVREIEFTATPADGSVSTDIVNKAGVILPETGGIGTTLFYVIGGLLAVVAVVLLVTKKRMVSAE